MRHLIRYALSRGHWPCLLLCVHAWHCCGSFSVYCRGLKLKIVLWCCLWSFPVRLRHFRFIPTWRPTQRKVAKVSRYFEHCLHVMTCVWELYAQKERWWVNQIRRNTEPCIFKRTSRASAGFMFHGFDSCPTPSPAVHTDTRTQSQWQTDRPYLNHCDSVTAPETKS